MIKKEAQKTILKLLGYADADIATMVDGDTEVDVTVPDTISILTAEQLATRDSVKIDEGKKQGINEGKSTFVKEITKKMGWDLKDDARIGDIVSQINDKLTETSDTKLKTLQEQNLALLKDKETLTQTITQKEQAYNDALFERDLIGAFPANRKTDLKDNQRLAALKTELSWEVVDGKVLTKKNGEVWKDATTHAPLEYNKAISEYFKENNWLSDGQQQQQGGRGTGNSNISNTGVYNKFSEFQENWEKNNPQGNTLSPEFQTALGEAIKSNQNFDMNA